MIGKGSRSDAVKEAIREYKGVYFAAVGGAAALIAKAITKAETVAYGELGPEAILRLEANDFPAIVINDCHGGDLMNVESALALSMPSGHFERVGVKSKLDHYF